MKYHAKKKKKKIDRRNVEKYENEETKLVSF